MSVETFQEKRTAHLSRKGRVERERFSVRARSGVGHPARIGLSVYRGQMRPVFMGLLLYGRGKGEGGERRERRSHHRRREVQGAPIGSNVHLFSVRDRWNRVGGRQMIYKCEAARHAQSSRNRHISPDAAGRARPSHFRNVAEEGAIAHIHMSRQVPCCVGTEEPKFSQTVPPSIMIARFHISERGRGTNEFVMATTHPPKTHQKNPI